VKRSGQAPGVDEAWPRAGDGNSGASGGAACCFGLRLKTMEAYFVSVLPRRGDGF
jgi:hypothetical protein